MLVYINYVPRHNSPLLASCSHSLRSVGALRAIQLQLGHTKLESTVRYLGIDVDDALEMAEQTES